MTSFHDFKPQDLIFLEPLYRKIKINTQMSLEDSYETVYEEPGEEPIHVYSLTNYLHNKDITFLKRLVTGSIDTYYYCPECEKEVYINSERVPLDKEFQDDVIASFPRPTSHEESVFYAEEAETSFKKYIRHFFDKYLDQSNTFTRHLVCTASKKHKITITFRISRDMYIEKIGQFPAVYSFDNKAHQYKKILTKENRNELNKAIGLKTHGNGVGAYVYLRRVFERLLHEKIDEAFVSDNTELQKVKKYRIEDKISAVKHFLPEFLVNNSFLYNILSKGIHELSEEECLSYFEPVKEAILVILEEDYEKDRRASFQKELGTELSNIHAKMKND
ncbi:hypothetical protein [Paenibacillus silvae]|uniref:hypothetical protein n=1 Tax=Paenibacillus silvae TaxID=1325358 RepID=UPI002003A34F|nr:hypothetical protein [Paenibacillus silvae]MCK6076280.1 hypothetical protein [Paenibacillus silvae]MCK6150561.1 hypothetical protein [Paenibacillus silvae]MCK6268821.1 hypothetical protein [Paenibacillus silvae]MCK6270414.1 hypothetical protein [Paenibacillus silvae]